MKKKVLIVEDEDVIRNVIIEYLVEKGYEPLIAKDGTSAISVIDSARPDIILADFFLPDMVAVDFLIYAKKFNPHIPIILITSMWNVGCVNLAFNSGASDFVPKPLDFPKLLDTMEFWLNEAPAKIKKSP